MGPRDVEQQQPQQQAFSNRNLEMGSSSSFRRRPENGRSSTHHRHHHLRSGSGKMPVAAANQLNNTMISKSKRKNNQQARTRHSVANHHVILIADDEEEEEREEKGGNEEDSSDNTSTDTDFFEVAVSVSSEEQEQDEDEELQFLGCRLNSQQGFYNRSSSQRVESELPVPEAGRGGSSEDSSGCEVIGSSKQWREAASRRKAGKNAVERVEEVQFATAANHAETISAHKIAHKTGSSARTKIYDFFAKRPSKQPSKDEDCKDFSTKVAATSNGSPAKESNKSPAKAAEQDFATDNLQDVATDNVCADQDVATDNLSVAETKKLPEDASGAVSREMLRQAPEFQKADEQEWAARQLELQKQALEAQKLKKRKKAEAERQLQMENRQRQRLEEIRESQKKEEQTLGMKEQLRGNVRTELETMAVRCVDMASLLQRLGIDLGAGSSPSVQQVNAGYKQALLKFHPDRASSSGDIRSQVEAEEKFKLISRLKTVLRPVVNL